MMLNRTSRPMVTPIFPTQDRLAPISANQIHSPPRVHPPIPSDESHLQETSEDPNREASNSEDVNIEDLTVSPALEPAEPPEPAKPRRKLRTAKDVLSRLRWDSTYDINDFIIVYKDRFE